MRLTLQRHHVTGVDWGPATRLQSGHLAIDREGLLAELLRDERLAGVELDLVHPGDSCRLLGIFDVVEPRAKLDPAGADFPGALSPVHGVGFGVTRVLQGLAVTILDPAPTRGGGHTIDMPSSIGFKPGQDASVQALDSPAATPLAAVHHLVLTPRLAAGVDGDDAKHTLRLACLRAAAHLARTAEVNQPDQEETLELTATSPDLPRVAYVYQLHSHQIPTVPGEPLLYGDNCRHLLPTILHPNEILDGALVRSYYYLGMETYGIQNNAVVTDLYRRHGRDLTFAGVVAYVANQLPDERDRATVMASNLVKWALRADGAVFTKSIGGAPHVDMGLVADRCEQLGVRTTLLANATGEGEDSSLFNFAALNAIVATAPLAAGTLVLEPPARVLTARPDGGEGLRGAMSVQSSRYPGAADQLGGGRLTTARY